MGYKMIIRLIAVIFAVSWELDAAKHGNGSSKNGNNGSNHGFVCDEIKDVSQLKVDSNKPTVIVFYSQTCPSCTEIKEPFNAFVNKYKADINCAAIDVNGGARGFAQMLKISQVPTTVVIHKRIGASSAEKLESYLRQMTGMTAFAQGNGGATKVISQEVAVKTVEGKTVPVDEDFDKDDYLKPTEKPLQVNPEDIEVLYDEEDMLNEPKFDDEIETDMVIRGSRKPDVDVMP